jgi:hypothetical protein
VSRASFLARLVDRAKDHGNTIYEELQGNSVVASAIADWRDVAKDTALGVKEDLDTVAAWASPTIDATPGKHTLEDTIDEFIFDPATELAPLDLIGLGVASTSKAAMKGIRHAAKKVGFKVDDIVRGGRKAKEVVPVKAVPAKRTGQAVEGFSHARGGASVEQMARDAGGTVFYRVNPAGKAVRVIGNAEDAALRAGRDAIVKVLPDGSSHVEAGQVLGKRMQDAIFALKPGKARDVSKAKTVTLDLGKKATDEEDFLKSLGVQPGRGPVPK